MCSKVIKATFVATLLLVNNVLTAQVTYSEHIAPIIYDNCTSCHRPGEIGPNSFTSYQEVADWARMIEYVTTTKFMPPFPPDTEYSKFIGERGLTDDEIQLIADWVDQGMEQGDAAKEPALPSFPVGSQIGVPDLVLKMSDSYLIEGNNTDDYRVFVLPTGFTEDKEIAAMEFRAGNARAVHHTLFAYDVSGEAKVKDAETAEYGYEVFGDFGISDFTPLTWSYVPGTEPLVYPEGIGEIIPAGADILIQVHYAPLPTDETDQSTVNIFFKKKNDPIERTVETAVVSPINLIGGPFSFVIPPNKKTTFKTVDVIDLNSYTFGINEDISIIGVNPHAHYLGESFEVFAITPVGDTINIISIEDWDFNWQGAYTFERMKKIPANSVVHTTTSYDNTVDNPYNPSSPPQNVTWGEGTKDEMLLVGLYYVPYSEGDEDVNLGDSGLSSVFETVSPTKSQLFPPTPNPTQRDLGIKFELETTEDLSIMLTQMNGELVEVISERQKWQPGLHTMNTSIEALPAGIYLLRLQGSSYVLTQKVIVVK